MILICVQAWEATVFIGKGTSGEESRQFISKWLKQKGSYHTEGKANSKECLVKTELELCLSDILSFSFSVPSRGDFICSLASTRLNLLALAHFEK